jgi:hypothetical protein
MTTPIHFEVEVLYATTFTTACGSRAGKHLTTDDAQVTCRKCLAALGYAAAPVERADFEPKELPDGRFQVAA